jgi:hypothetical protein
MLRVNHEQGDYSGVRAEEPAQINGKSRKKEGDEPNPRHWWKTAVAASFPT